MRWALRIVLLCLILSSCSSGANETAPPVIRIVDVTPDFWDFWDAIPDSAPPAGQAARFLDRFVVRHPELFTPSVLENKALTGDVKRIDALTRATQYLEDLPPYIARMRNLSAMIGLDLQRYARDFAGTFPDYASATPITFTLSLFNFDGATRLVGNQTTLLFGIDGMARYHENDSDLKILFDHELFHQYHAQIAPELTRDEAPLWVALWEEGLATYVSLRMNPEASEAQALMFPHDLAERAAAVLPQLVKELQANFDSVDHDEYALFFYGRQARQDWPPRAGYYVGYQIAERLGHAYSLQELASLRGPELRAAVLQTLDALAP